MPVILEQITQPGSDELQDLAKIYEDYPGLSPNIPQWINSELGAGRQLFAGRFNGRLLAAVWIDTTSGQWQLDKLCVRKITRRRGTARQLLTLLAKKASSEKADLAVSNHELPPELHSLMSELGFVRSEPTTWICKPQ